MPPTDSDTTTERALLAAVPTGCLIDGRWRPAARGELFTVFDPATGLPLTQVSDAAPEDVSDALDAACRAQPVWAATAPRQRSELLRRAYDLLHTRREEFALLITLEMGKPLAESRAEVAYAADYLLWFSEQAVRIAGEYRISPQGDSRIVTMRQPVGPCLLVTPWNFPLAMMTRKAAPAFAAGCTAILKPAEDTPLTCLYFAQILVEADIPAGVVNVLPTSRPAPLVAQLLADPRLRKLSFTGSTEVGRSLAATAGARMLRSSMELGGNAPFLVFEDADLQAAVEGALLAKLRNAGESCVAANRFLVHEDLADAFTSQLADRMSSLVLARGTDPAAQMGPLINERQRARVARLVDDAVARGAQVVTGGGPRLDPGWFYPPTVLADVPPGAMISSQEVFGPVATVCSFKGEDEAVRLANDTEAGLVAYLYTRDINRALRVSELLDAGMVGLNRGLVSNAAAPFGGVKQSGLGKEGGFEGLDEYLTIKYLAVDQT
ncbi:succinate-semialdehyde dehydrogenase/glutarate-semialdehyde dehydrogenase [Streptacidiphilus sp. MAP12-16]|uniref:NAD-dependent succinate-semialdehyde dehydrogenase n=1 Tax=Streptacidiphilus sp. MAP12-16 TaxID=3156300 RepID=UPI003512FA17